MRPKTAQIIGASAGALVTGMISMVLFIQYGGNRCDQPPAMACDCFCCNWFGSRGYEACGQFGGIAGLIGGAIVGILLVRLIINKNLK